MTTLVSMNDVEKVYQNGTVAVQNVNLDIREGEFVSFVGPSGCGKSTIFRMIAGLGQPSGGQIRIFGEEAGRTRGSRDLSFVFQDATLMPWCTVFDNVTLPLKLRRVPKKVQREEAERVLELVGLQDYGKALPRHLSGGMKMRVSIARALVAHPKLLLMDEPFGALDEITRQTLQHELLAIWQRNPKMTVLFVTHNVFEAVFLSTRIVIMTPRPGRIAEQIDVPVPYPREEQFRTTAEFGRIAGLVNAALRH